MKYLTVAVIFLVVGIASCSLSDLLERLETASDDEELQRRYLISDSSLKEVMYYTCKSDADCTKLNKYSECNKLEAMSYCVCKSGTYSVAGVCDALKTKGHSCYENVQCASNYCKNFPNGRCGMPSQGNIYRHLS